jgi:flagellar motor switch protein FliM
MRADAPAWIELPRGVAFVMVDLLLGGRQAGRYVPARRLTEIERRVLLRVIGLAAGAMGRFLPGRVGIEFRAGMETPLPSESPPGAPATVATFELEILGQVGTMRLCVLAGPEEAPPLGGARAGDGPLLLTVASEEIDVSADELATLAPGDIVVTDTPADGEVIVRVAGIPKFAARLGACDGRPAITITRKLNPGERPRAAPPSG